MYLSLNQRPSPFNLIMFHWGWADYQQISMLFKKCIKNLKYANKDEEWPPCWTKEARPLPGALSPCLQQTRAHSLDGRDLG